MDKTFCIFGDSVAQAAYIKTGWVSLIKQYLEEKYKDDFINVFNLGVGGNTTGDILKRFNCEAQVRNPNFILFAVGINDTKSNDLKQFRINLEKLINLAKKYTSEITFVGLVLGNYTSEEPFSKSITTTHNQVLKVVAKAEKCKFVQLQESLKPEDFIDGLHPNEQGHRKMFKVIKKYL